MTTKHELVASMLSWNCWNLQDKKTSSKNSRCLKTMLLWNLILFWVDDFKWSVEVVSCFQADVKFIFREFTFKTSLRCGNISNSSEENYVKNIFLILSEKSFAIFLTLFSFLDIISCWCVLSLFSGGVFLWADELCCVVEFLLHHIFVTFYAKTSLEM